MSNQITKKELTKYKILIREKMEINHSHIFYFQCINFSKNSLKKLKKILFTARIKSYFFNKKIVQKKNNILREVNQGFFLQISTDHFDLELINQLKLFKKLKLIGVNVNLIFFSEKKINNLKSFIRKKNIYLPFYQLLTSNHIRLIMSFHQISLLNKKSINE